MSDDPQTVSYPIAGQLDKIDAKLDKIDAKLDTKADRSDLVRVEKKVDLQNGRIAALETAETVRKARGGTARAVADSKRANWALAVGGLAALGAIAEAIIQAVGH